MSEAITIVLADDHPLMREGIENALRREGGLRVVGRAADSYEAMDLALSLRPRVLILDLNMPGPRPADVVRHLGAQAPQTRVLVLTAYDDDARVRELADAGAAGYLVKDEPPETLLRAVRAVARGTTWFPGSLRDRLAEGGVRPGGAPLLDDREREVLRHVVAGETDREIAATLYLSERTVRRTLRGLFDRLGVSSRVELAARAGELGIGPLS